MYALIIIMSFICIRKQECMMKCKKKYRNKLFIDLLSHMLTSLFIFYFGSYGPPYISGFWQETSHCSLSHLKNLIFHHKTTKLWELKGLFLTSWTSTLVWQHNLYLLTFFSELSTASHRLHQLSCFSKPNKNESNVAHK